MAAKEMEKQKKRSSSVCRVFKNTAYAVMSNYHLMSTAISLKATGLLSKVLNLPDKWDYSVKGLASICKEKETAIETALDELKDTGYAPADWLHYSAAVATYRHRLRSIRQL